MDKRLVLICDKSSKRYSYFINACQHYNTQVTCFDYCDFNLLEGDIVKIDPIKINSHCLNDFNYIIQDYTNKLLEIATYNVSFFNHPNTILLLLDKYKTKKNLEKVNIPTTPMIDVDFSSVDDLFSYLILNNLSRVFIKPRFGAGASGIIALHYNFNKNETVLFTTIVEKNNKFYNSNNTNYVNNQIQVYSILNFIITLPIVVEKWLPKKKYNNINYDLRVVMFKQEMLYIVARGSNSPITNLHLNNMALDENIITNKDEIYMFCRNVMSQFPDLTYAGIDLLITQNNELFVIELNSQGDAIYNDFYNNNIIYKRQVLHYNNLKND